MDLDNLKKLVYECVSSPAVTGGVGKLIIIYLLLLLIIWVIKKNYFI